MSALDETEAQSLSERIRLLADSTAVQLAELQSLVEEAKAAGVHDVLGYPSWTSYLADVLAGLWRAVDQVQRREVVGLLTDQGLSSRAVGRVIGVSHATVSRDLAGVSHETPGPEPGEPEGVVMPFVPRIVTGLDGKHYLPKERLPSLDEIGPPPISQKYTRAVASLLKAVHRIEQTQGEDRFAASRAILRLNHARSIEVAVARLTRIRAKLGDDE